MNILVHNAVMEEQLPAGGCSVFTIYHVAAMDTRNRVCVGGPSTYVHVCVLLLLSRYLHTGSGCP